MMKPIADFDELITRVRSLDVKRRVVVVCPHDTHTADVVVRALNEGLARFTLVTNQPDNQIVRKISQSFPSDVEICAASDADQAAVLGVKLVREGCGDVLMKGLLNTDNFLRAVLNKECGLLEKGSVLSHITLTHSPRYGKLLAFSDVAVIPRPTLEQYDAMIGYDIAVMRRLGVADPRVALLHFTEKTSDKFPNTIYYQQLKAWATEGRYGDCFIDGPMDIKTACDAESGTIKGMASPVVGNADILIFPNIESGNIFYKTMTFFAGTEIAAILCGTMVPVVLASRADSSQSKYNSLALACYTKER